MRLRSSAEVPEATQKAVDLLGESLTAPAPAVPQAQVPDLLGSLEASAQARCVCKTLRDSFEESAC